MKFTKVSPDEVKKKPTVQEIAARRRNPLYVMAENIRSRYNLGGIFRTCDAAFVEKIFLTGITPKPPHHEIDKSALGATEVVPWQYCHDATEAVTMLKSQSVQIVGLELTHESKPYNKVDYTFPLCLIIGNEVSGISQNMLNLCDEVVQIPMYGRAHSLNVVTAYGIAIFEILRQYKETHA